MCKRRKSFEHQRHRYGTITNLKNVLSLVSKFTLRRVKYLYHIVSLQRLKKRESQRQGTYERREKKRESFIVHLLDGLK